MKELEANLALSTAPWKIVVGHHPVYSSGSGHGGSPDLISNLNPILQQYGAQVRTTHIPFVDSGALHSQAHRIDVICQVDPESLVSYSPVLLRAVALWINDHTIPSVRRWAAVTCTRMLHHAETCTSKKT